MEAQVGAIARTISAASPLRPSRLGPAVREASPATARHIPFVTFTVFSTRGFIFHQPWILLGALDRAGDRQVYRDDGGFARHRRLHSHFFEKLDTLAAFDHALL